MSPVITQSVWERDHHTSIRISRIMKSREHYIDSNKITGVLNAMNAKQYPSQFQQCFWEISISSLCTNFQVHYCHTGYGCPRLLKSSRISFADLKQVHGFSSCEECQDVLLWECRGRGSFVDVEIQEVPSLEVLFLGDGKTDEYSIFKNCLMFKCVTFCVVWLQILYWGSYRFKGSFPLRNSAM